MDDFEKKQILQLNKIAEYKKTLGSYDKMFESQLLDQVGEFKSCCDISKTPANCDTKNFIDLDKMIDNNKKALTSLVGLMQLFTQMYQMHLAHFQKDL
jgi:5'(3')-deoxyribonucleotidase